jgi:cytoskeletal protein CcmA (bactofilin family)
VVAASPPPASGPATAPTAARPPPPPPRPRVGELRDGGTVRRDSVDAERWTGRGTIKVTGDVNVGAAALEGLVSISGKLAARSFRCEGTLEVDGPVDVAGRLDGSGGLRVGGTVHAGEADLRGDLQVAGAVSVDRILSVRGILSTPSLVAGGFELDGEAQIPGDVVGTAVSARFTHDSALGTVRARTVTLHAKAPNLIEKVFGRPIAVSVRRVEADTVDLEGVDVQFVRSPQITLGREAHITEYEGTIVRRHRSSRVGFESRSPPPYGLSR